MAAYSNDLRRKILNYSFSHSIAKTATTFAVSPNTVFLLKKLYEETGDVIPRKSNRVYDRLISREGEIFLEALILTEPDLSILDLRNAYEEEFSIWVSHGTMVNTLQRLNLTYKKKLF